MTKIRLYKGSITELEVGAIVNATNNELRAGTGVDGAIHKAAGPYLQIACNGIGKCETGDAKITRGFQLKSKYVIHTVGPCYEEQEAASLLESCYMKSLFLAKKHEIKAIAFPGISTGIQGYTHAIAAKIAVDSVKKFTKQFPNAFDEIIFVAFNNEAYRAYEELLT